MNLILTGFMGTGKSTVGRLVAARLKREFIDMDDVIVERAGMPIPEIFANAGEAAFRQWEREAVTALAARQSIVIATGGGALIDPANREALAVSGLIVCLDASAETIFARLDGSSDRPLLHGEDAAARIRALLAERAAAYAALPHHIQTDTLTPHQTAEAVLKLWQTYAT